MASYPEIDVPIVVDDWCLRLQSKQFLEVTHTISEDNSYFFDIAHTAIRLAINAGIETPQHRLALDTGAQVFEALGFLINPDKRYDTDLAKAVTFAGTMQFVESLKSTSDLLTIADYARARMEEDTPALTEVVTEVANRYTGYDPIATGFAVKGAAMIRGMQIFVDRRLEAA